jgi:hypothetical protein
MNIGADLGTAYDAIREGRGLKRLTLERFDKNSDSGFASLLDVPRWWKFKEDEESGATITLIEDATTVTSEQILKTRAFVVDGVRYYVDSKPKRHGDTKKWRIFGKENRVEIA